MPQIDVVESGPKPGLRERNKRDKLERIVQAAGDLFREQGFEQTTGRQICERAGIGTGTLFLYVKDKRELLSLIFEPLANEVFARLPRGLGSKESLVDGLARLFGALFRLYARDHTISKLFVQDLLFSGYDSPGMQTLHDELRDRVVELVRDAQARKALRSDISAEQLSTAFLAHYVFWLQLWLGSGGVSQRVANQGLRSALRLQFEGVRMTRKGRR